MLPLFTRKATPFLFLSLTLLSVPLYAYVFQYDIANGWAQVAKLTGPDGARGDYFGHSVSVSNNTAVVGSPMDNDPNNDDDCTNFGSAYVYSSW
jgi:hypothetical protein